MVFMGIGRFIIGFLLVLSLTMLIFSSAFSAHYTKENLRDFITENLKKQISSVDSTQHYLYYLEKCEGQTEIIINEDSNLKLNCDQLREISPKELPELIVDSLFEQTYYQKYENIRIQDYLSGGKINIIISDTAVKFVHKLRYLFGITTLILLASFILLSLPFTKVFMRMGIIGIIAGSPCLYLNKLLGNLIVGETMPQFFIDSISTASTLYFISLLFGIGLIITGIAIKITLKSRPNKMIKKQTKNINKQKTIIEKQKEVIKSQENLINLKQEQKKLKQKPISSKKKSKKK